MPANNHDSTWTLISLKLSGEASEQELKMLEGLTKTDPSLANQLQLLEAWWNHRRPENDPSFACFFEKLQGRRSEKSQ